MFRHALRILPIALLLSAPAAYAQLLDQPTPTPTVTADNEQWFVDRAPILIGGTLYYPAGSRIHFNQNEMVRTGFYGMVPLYVRTTLEPRSVIFVPLSGGVMQPYERKRSGELAGTEGSSAPSFPVQNPAEVSGEMQPIRAAGPPSSLMGDSRRVAVDSYPAPTASPVDATATTGSIPASHVRIGGKPEGLNGVFIAFDNQRWFNSGPAVPLDTTLKKVGTLHDLPVYARSARPTTIYVPVSQGVTSLVVPYSIGRGR